MYAAHLQTGIRQPSLKRVFVVCLLLPPAVASIRPLHARNGPIIAEIRIAGNQRMSVAQLKANLRLKEGGVYAKAVQDEDVRRLLGLGYLATVAKEMTPDNQVVLTFKMMERPVVKGVYFEGNRALNNSELAGHVSLKEEDILQPYLLDLDRRSLAMLHKEKGFPFVKIDCQIEECEEGGVIVRYLIREGSRVIVEDVQFDGNDSIEASTLFKLMETKRHIAVFSQSFLNEEQIELDVRQIEAYYRAQGWLDAEAFLADVVFNADNSKAKVRIQIIERERYKVAEVRISGNVIFSSDTLLANLKLNEGDDFVFMDLNKDISDIQVMYGENGYHLIRGRQLDLKITYAETDHTVGIHYLIEEQGKSYIGRIHIRGNVKTKDVVVLRELSFFPGEEFNLREIQASVKRLSRLGIFDNVDTEIKPAEAPDVRDVEIRIEEAKTGRLSFSVGFSSVDNVIGQVVFQQRNFDYQDLPDGFLEIFNGKAFVGDGQTLSIAVKGGFIVKEYTLDFLEPYLFDRPWRFGWGLFLKERVYSDYDESRLGYYVRLGRRILPDLNGNIIWRSEIVDVSNIDDAAEFVPVNEVDSLRGREPNPDNPAEVSSDLKLEERNSLVNRVRFTMDLDLRDSPFFPTEGGRIEAGYEFAGAFLGGEQNFWKTTLDTEWHHTAFEIHDRKHIVSLGGEAGWAGTHSGDSRVPIFERFFAGGSNKLRGFQFRSLGPQQNDDPVGGNFSVIGKAEYSLPLVQEIFRGVVFYDIGNVYADIDEYDFDGMRSSTGFEIRIVIPQLGPIPIRFGYAVPVQTKPGDDLEHFYVDFGAIF